MTVHGSSHAAMMLSLFCVWASTNPFLRKKSRNFCTTKSYSVVSIISLLSYMFSISCGGSVIILLTLPISILRYRNTVEIICPIFNNKKHVIKLVFNNKKNNLHSLLFSA